MQDVRLCSQNSPLQFEFFGIVYIESGRLKMRGERSRF